MLICEKEISFEELEVLDYLLEVGAKVRLCYTKGEREVRYYPDGSGYPGSPDDCEGEVLDYDVLHAYDAKGDEVQVVLPAQEVEKAMYKKMDYDFLRREFNYEIDSYLHPEDYRDYDE